MLYIKIQKYLKKTSRSNKNNNNELSNANLSIQNSTINNIFCFDVCYDKGIANNQKVCFRRMVIRTVLIIFR